MLQRINEKKKMRKINFRYLFIILLFFINCTQSKLVKYDKDYPYGLITSKNGILTLTSQHKENSLSLINRNERTLHWELENVPTWLEVNKGTGAIVPMRDDILIGKIKEDILKDTSTYITLKYDNGHIPITVRYFNVPVLPEKLLLETKDYIIRNSGSIFYNYLEEDTYLYYVPQKKAICTSYSNITMEKPDKVDTPFYQIIYYFKIPDKPWIDEFVSVQIDTNGIIKPSNVLPDSSIFLLDEPFQIDESTAIEIAQKAGLENGLEKKWKTSFHWHNGYKEYVWVVSNTIKIDDFRKPKFKSGNSIIINPHSGKILKRSGWLENIDYVIGKEK